MAKKTSRYKGVYLHNIFNILFCLIITIISTLSVYYGQGLISVVRRIKILENGVRKKDTIGFLLHIDTKSSSLLIQP